MMDLGYLSTLVASGILGILFLPISIPISIIVLIFRLLSKEQQIDRWDLVVEGAN